MLGTKNVIGDDVARRHLPPVAPPFIEAADALAAFKAIVSDSKHAVVAVEFMGMTPAVEVDIVPVFQLTALQRVPESSFIGVIKAVRVHGCTQP